MRDLDVRRVLNKEIMSLFPYDPEPLIINELGICQGQARIDIAVINGNIHGFEIKSENDTLERLPSQLEIYNKVLETMTIVTSEKHLDKAEEIVPQWWGIIKASQTHDEVNLKQIRKGRKNPSIDPFSLVQLLWHDEALSILEKHKMADGVRSKTRRHIWNVLAQNIPLPQLLIIIRDTLKNRGSLKKRNTFVAD